MRLLRLPIHKKIKQRDLVKGSHLLTISKDNKTRVNQEAHRKVPALNNSRNAEMHRLPEFRRQNQQKKKFKIRSELHLAKLSGGSKKGTGAKYRKEKSQANFDAQEQQLMQDQEASKHLR